MTPAINSLYDISDEDLLRYVAHLARQERHATAQLIASLTELDARKLYLREGCAYYCNLLQSARHKSRREVEQIVASLRPKPDVPTSIRKLPEQKVTKSRDAQCAEGTDVVEAKPESARQVTTVRQSVIAPLAPARYRMQFTMSEESYQMLLRAQKLLRHTIPNGDPAEIVDRALTLLVEHLEKTKCAATARPRASCGVAAASRHIPAAVRRVVWARDGGQCAFVGAAGRCTERGCLEFHHLVPHASGGPPTVGNIALRCRSHNQYEALQEFPLFVRERIAAYILPFTHPASGDPSDHPVRTGLG
jgi:hypothetical protein